MPDQQIKPQQFRSTQSEQSAPGGVNKFFWFALLWTLFLFFLFRHQSTAEIAEISYTHFKRHLAQGHVETITIKGDQIRGVFSESQEIGPEERQHTQFATTIPSFEDPQLVQLLEQQDVTITAESTQTSWLSMALLNLLPWIMILGFILYSSKRMQERMGGPGGLFGFARSKAQRYQRTESAVKFSDVAGLDNAKKDLQEIIDYLKHPSKYVVLGAKLPKGILLMGPPGTGKTLLARACAGEAEVPFFSISGSEFIEMFVGVGASRVRDMFQNAKQDAPAILFIDEIDSIGRARGTGVGGGHDEREQTLNQILAEMDGFSSHEAVVVIAATNRPDVLDAALTRPGRFDRHITLELPHKEARLAILQIHSRNVPVADTVDLAVVAQKTIGLSGADLQNLVNEATLLAGRKNKQQVELSDFDEARDKILMGSEREDLIGDTEKQLIAYHEAGHALLACYLPKADPLQKVTITPRGRALGATEQLPMEDRHNLSRTYLLDRLAVMLGGRVAEKLTFDDISSGAADDLKRATQLAQRMICQWGMSETLGPVIFQRGEEHPFLGRELATPKDFSEQTAREIDLEIKNIVAQEEARATHTLEKHHTQLRALATALLEHETLEKKEVDAIVGGP